MQGTLVLEQSKHGVLQIEGKLSNITLGNHGIHIHEFGKTSNKCLDAGGHCMSVTNLNPLQWLQKKKSENMPGSLANS